MIIIIIIILITIIITMTEMPYINPLSQIFYTLSYNKNTQINPELWFMKSHMDYITGRNIQSYLHHFFPHLKKKIVLHNLKNKSVLDLGSGLNHLVPNSFLAELDKKNIWAKGLDVAKLPRHPLYIKESLYDTKLSSNSIDLILSQYVLYSHISTVKLLKKALREIDRILVKEGEFRVYPVYFGNYYLGDERLKRWIDKKFFINVIEPEFYVDRNKKLCHVPCKGEYEVFKDSYTMELVRHYIMDVKTIVFIKK